ncbi:MAG: hypothetical protein J6Y32_01960 [Bacteroidales bacterium]|nr:hypothetical protein [Bacteroidales bacterium]
MRLRNVLLLLSSALLLAASCVKVNTDLGQNFAPLEHRYDVFCEDFPLNNIVVERMDSSFAFSSNRIVVGAVRDERYGLCTKSAAFSLTPLVKELNFGKETQFTGMMLSLACDSLSLPYGGDPKILQKMRIYALDEATDINDPTEFLYSCDVKKLSTHFAGAEPVTDYVPVFGGEDTLNFHFKPAFYNALGAKLLARANNGVYTLDNPDTLSNSTWLKDFPGFYLTCDDPEGNGGRFNLLGLKLGLDTQTYTITSNFASLHFKAKYKGSSNFTDTSFVFLIGGISIPQSSESLPTQKAFNGSEHEALPILDGMTLNGDCYAAGEKIYVEGGSGLRPVFSAKEIRERLLGDFAAKKVTDASKVIIDRATLILRYPTPTDFGQIEDYPRYLAPAHLSRYIIRDRVYGQTKTLMYTDFPPVTDASVTDEDQGGISRSLQCYSPDISFHVQHLIKLQNPSDQDLERQDILFFIKHAETIVTQTVSNSNQDYYNQMLYYSYLNSLYGGGTGSYNNYYNMMYYYNMTASSSSGTTTSVQVMQDEGRYYNAVFCGPDDASGKGPVLRVVYSVPLDAIAK